MDVQIFGVKKDADTRKALRFFKERRIKVHFVDFKTRGCRDGLMASGVNQNQGAESTLAWLQALLTMIEMRSGDPTSLRASTKEGSVERSL